MNVYYTKANNLEPGELSAGSPPRRVADFGNVCQLLKGLLVFASLYSQYPAVWRSSNALVSMNEVNLR